MPKKPSRKQTPAQRKPQPLRPVDASLIRPVARMGSFLIVPPPLNQRFFIYGLQMALIVDGEMSVLMEKGRRQTARAGDMVVFPHGENEYDMIGTKAVSFYQVHFGLGEEAGEDAIPFVEGMGPLPRYLPGICNKPQVCIAFERAITALCDLGPLWKLEFSAAVLDLVRLAFENVPQPKAAPQREFTIWDRILHRLEDHQNEPLIKDLAGEFRMSPEALIRGFQRQMGITPKQFVLQRKLWRARKFLIEGKPVKEAALHNGFTDPQYFSRIYRQFFGFAPTETGSQTGSLPFETHLRVPIGRTYVAPGENIERFRRT